MLFWRNITLNNGGLAALVNNKIVAIIRSLTKEI
jgi:hypothetical protein